MYEHGTAPVKTRDPTKYKSLHEWVLGMAETVPEFGPYFGVYLEKFQLGKKD